MKDRLLSGSIIVKLGFLLLVLIIVNGASLIFSSNLETILPAFTVMFFNMLNVLISFIVIAVLSRVFLIYCRMLNQMAGCTFRRDIYRHASYPRPFVDRALYFAYKFFLRQTRFYSRAHATIQLKLAKVRAVVNKVNVATNEWRRQRVATRYQLLN